MKTGQGDSDIAGVIHRDEMYTLTEFKRRTNLKDAALRSARRSGLRVLRNGSHAYVLGRDWIDFILQSSDRDEKKTACEGH